MTHISDTAAVIHETKHRTCCFCLGFSLELRQLSVLLTTTTATKLSEQQGKSQFKGKENQLIKRVFCPLVYRSRHAACFLSTCIQIPACSVFFVHLYTDPGMQRVFCPLVCRSRHTACFLSTCIQIPACSVCRKIHHQTHGNLGQFTTK